MNNHDVERLLNECFDELERIETLIDLISPTSSITPYLAKYSLIKACGTIEVAFKSIIADFCDKSSIVQLKNYIDSKIRQSSMNPSLNNIFNILSDFDQNWNNEFKTLLNNEPNSEKLKTSLASINSGRNGFAHGGDSSATISEIKDYFCDSRRIIEILDSVVK